MKQHDEGLPVTAVRHRKSARLKGYDYSQAGAYFVTICAHNRECIFGEVDNEQMVVNEWGEIVLEEWLRSREIRPEIELGEYAIMPNHFHGIVCISDHRRGDRLVALDPLAYTSGPPSRSLGAFMAGFKASVTKRINTNRKTAGRAVWQRNYYEHVIRDEGDYSRIVEYLINNPLRWSEDKLHPTNCAGIDVAGRKGGR